MQNTLTLASPTPTDPPRRSSGSLKAVNEWWTEFGEVGAASRPGKVFDPERVETSGLIYLKQLQAKSRPTMHFTAAVPSFAPVMTPVMTPVAAPVQAAPEVAAEPVSLPQPNALMPVFEETPSRSLGSTSTWLTALASVVLVASVGLIMWQTRRQSAPAACPVTQAPPPVAACDSAPPAGPVAPAPLGPRTAAAAPLAPAPAPAPDTAAPALPVVARSSEGRSRSARSDDEAPAAAEPAPAAPASAGSVYDTLASLKPAVAPVAPAPRAVVPAVAPVPEPVAAPREPRTAAEMLQATVAASKVTAPAVVEALPVTLPTAPLLATLRTRGGEVTACLRQFGFLRHTVQVRVTISGSTGRLAFAQALGEFAGTPAGKCVARSFNGLSFGRFQTATQSVTLPFVVR